MTNKSLAFIFSSFAFLLISRGAAALTPIWSYSDPVGPNLWGTLPGDAMCMKGIHQSPVDIETGKMAGIRNVHSNVHFSELKNDWKRSQLSILNNGHTVELKVDSDSVLLLDGIKYGLHQFHFHSPSEHILNGHKYPLEAHFVHFAKNPADSTHPLIAVVAIFFEEGKPNAPLQTIWDYTPVGVTSNAITPPNVYVNAADFLPAKKTYFGYEGSLTTPPCTEGVQWLILSNPISASTNQLGRLQKLLNGPNSRPTQPLDGRTISLNK